MFNKEKREEITALVKRVRDGDEKAFEDLYTATWSMIYYTVCRYLKDSGTAEDVTQEVFLIVNKEIGKLRDEELFIVWVNRIAENSCKVILKTMDKNQHVTISEADAQPSLDANSFLPEDILANKETRDEILNIVMQLPPEQRRAILLYYYERLPTAEISQIMGISQTAVRMKLSRARSFIKSKMGKMGFAFSEVVITKALTLDAENLCTPQLRDAIQERITMSINSGVAPTGSAAAHNMSGGLLKGAGVFLTATAVTAVGVAGYSRWREPEPPRVEPVVATSAVAPAPSPSPTAEVRGIHTLEDMVGVEDAVLIINFGTAGENRNKKLKDITKRHGMETLGAYVDMARPTDDSYIMYELVKEDKRLLICERYNPLENRWSAAYRLLEIEEAVPEGEGYAIWYEEVDALGEELNNEE